MGKTRRILSMLLVAVMLLATASLGISCTKQEEGDKVTTALSSLEAHLNALKSEYDYTADNMSALQTAYDSAVKAIKDAADDAAVDTALNDGKAALEAIERVGEKQYTLREYIEVSPSTWNVHTWETNGDSYIFGYTEIGWVDSTMKSEGEYQWTYEMADAIEDITTQATAEDKAKWNITDDQTWGRMYKITLNKNAKWEDGTPITADTYIYSMQQLLSSEMKNTRADLYWNGENAVYNGEMWFKQDKIGSKSFAPIGDLGFASAGEAIAAGYELYIDLGNFWGVAAEDGSTVLPVTDETLIRDPAIEEGQPEDYVSAKYLYETYLADGAPYATYASAYLMFVAGEIKKIDWSDVGLYKLSDYELVYVTQKPNSMFNFLVSGSSLWLVYEPLYEAGKKTVENLVTTNYGTSLDTYKGYGPYKLATYEQDKQIRFVRNENWYGWTDGKHEGQFQTTQIQCDIISDHATVLQMFNKGELDTVELTADDLEEYGSSDYLLKTPESYTMRFFFNTNLDVLKKLEAERNDGNNIQILSIQEFRKAMSWCFDRETWAKEVTAGEIPQVSLLSTLYFYDVENNPKSVYRNSEQAMKGIVDYYGLTYGEGQRYETLEEAYRACTGFDLDKARELFTEAYNKAIEQGIYKDGQNIVIHVGAAKGAETNTLAKQEKKFNDFLKAGTQGTPLEGKVSVKYIYNLNDRYGDVADGLRECGYGGLGGATFYPYRGFNSYIDAENAVGGKISEGNFDAKKVMVTITYDFNGDGTPEEVTDTLFNWNASLNAGGKYDAAPHELKLTILSAIEVTILKECHTFPITVTASVTLYSKKIKYATTNYNVMYGYGGVRLMTYNYSDYEWAQYVASQGGTLNYK